MADDTDDLRARLATVWEAFARDQCAGYSPLYEDICRAVARDDAVLALAARAPLFGRQPNVLLAAAHHLILGGAGGPLAEIYRAGGGPEAGAAFCDFVLAHRDEVEELLATRRTNTNECGRAAVLVPALRWAAGIVGEPLALLDAGASAGLNLLLDRFRIDYGARGATGPADSPVVIAAEVEGDPPIEAAAPAITARCGLDRDPVDLRDPDSVRWQLACVWPGTGRLERTRAAIDLTRDAAPTVLRGDLVDDLAAAAATLPGPGPLAVVTSWALAYLRPADRSRFADAVRSLSHDRAVVWVAAEAPGVVEAVEPPALDGDGITPSVLSGVVCRDGAVARATLLGTCHPHGNWLRWLAT